MLGISLHVIGVGLFFLLLFTCIEIIFRKYRIQVEVTRKINHMLCAVIVAMLPLYISYTEIAILGAIFTFVLLGSKKLGIFNSIHSVKRKTYGEVWFPLAVTVLALLQLSRSTFVVALLVMGFSDTLANIVGKKWGTHTYLIWGHTKSFEGSMACFVCTLVIIMASLLATNSLQGLFSLLISCVAISALVTLAEAISPSGSDNFTIPLVTALLLSL